MVKRNSLIVFAILLGASLISDELHARGGGGGGGHGGGGFHGGGSMRSSGMRSNGSMRAGGMRSSGQGYTGRSGYAQTGGRYGYNNGTNAALVGGAVVGGAALGAAAANRAGTNTGAMAGRTTGTSTAQRGAVGAGTRGTGRTVPSNVRNATQNAAGQRITAGRGEASSINRQANSLRAPRGGNTNQRNRPQSFKGSDGRRNYSFWRNGRNNIVSFRGGIPFLWYGGYWAAWPLFWNYWPWWYGAYYGDSYGSYDDCYDCDYNDCPDYCYGY